MLPGSRQGPHLFRQKRCGVTDHYSYGTRYLQCVFDQIVSPLTTLPLNTSLWSGTDLGLAFEIPPHIKNQPLFASCVLKVSKDDCIKITSSQRRP